jgi:hypothetical protein
MDDQRVNRTGGGVAQILPRFSLQSLLWLVTLLALLPSAYLAGFRHGTKRGEQVGYERGGIDAYKGWVAEREQLFQEMVKAKQEFDALKGVREGPK